MNKTIKQELQSIIADAVREIHQKDKGKETARIERIIESALYQTAIVMFDKLVKENKLPF